MVCGCLTVKLAQLLTFNNYLYRIKLTGSKSNVTLNLSGIVILGLSLSAAVSFWAYTLSALEKTPFANLFNQHQIGKVGFFTVQLHD